MVSGPTETLRMNRVGKMCIRDSYKISQLSPEESAKGVIACSAGNHAQGVALAATRRGIKSIVCMPAVSYTHLELKSKMMEIRS